MLFYAIFCKVKGDCFHASYEASTDGEDYVYHPRRASCHQCL